MPYGDLPLQKIPKIYTYTYIFKSLNGINC